jgi:pimeloyl-ACP methyl ester carboxylesterase
MTKSMVADHYVTAQDGLRLHVREYGARTAPALPVVCLPGLARTTADFDPLAAALAGDVEHPRRVLALDYRGRGLSDYDPDPDRYSSVIEREDVLTELTACAVASAVFVGTSRGGVLNDIGPVIEPHGLMRIKSYVGKLAQPRSFAEGADILRRLFGAQFPRLSDADWLASAQQSWREQDGRLVVTYDPRLARALATVDPEHPMPPQWAQFDALADVPMMVIRGANSDILSAATLAAMRARRGETMRETTIMEIPDQGHAPLLAEPETIARIAAFIAECDRHHAG